MKAELIPGGYILLSRKLLSSGIMQQPPLYMKLWVWMLMQASFKDHGNLKRGQFFTSLKLMQKAMTHKVGYRAVRPTIKEIRGVTKFLTKVRMIGTTKVLHGMVITVLNYNHYQTFRNYEGHDEGHTQGHNEGTILRKKGLKKENPPDFLSLQSRYKNQELIDQAFSAIASTRKCGKIADSIKVKALKAWEKYPVEIVERSIQTYLSKNCAADGKDEKYLLGIIRKQKPEKQTPTSTGSPLLDSYYANAN